MKQVFIIMILFIAVSFYGMYSCHEKIISPEKNIAEILISQTDSLDSGCHLLLNKIQGGDTNTKDLQKLFLEARECYKSFEWAAEYFEPATSRFMNGPPVQEIELSGQVFNPAGLQVIESLLFPKYDTANKIEIIKQLDFIRSGCRKYRLHFSDVEILDWQVFDAAKLEVFRIETLGITGFDNPLSLQSSLESAKSLNSLKRIIALYRDDKWPNNLSEKIDSAIAYLESHKDFNSFDRAEFITAYCDPITIGISDLESQLKIHVIRYNRLLNQDAKTLFDPNAFNVNAYVPDYNSFTSKEKIELGRMLFSDPSLSGDGSRSCQSCHQPAKAFTDGLVKNNVLGRHQLLSRNTPTLINAALQPSLFYDLRAKTLEDQSLTVVQSNEEMHGSMKLSVEKLWRDRAYQRMFSNAFPKKNRNGIDTLEIMNAISSYVRSLVFLNSRFDEYMRGNKNAMNKNEVNGFNLFMGKAKCATCHYMPLFNGNFPPRFVKTDAEVIGVPKSIEGKEIDDDLGRYNLVRVASLRHAFKTPSLRNVSRTAPYMHNGIFSTLGQVMDFYKKGGGAGLGLTIENQTLPFDKLSLDDKEIGDIIMFLKTLDSE